MRDKLSLDSQSFFHELERYFLKCSSEFLRTAVSDNSKWKRANFENRVRIKTRNKEDLVVLALLSWYIPEEFGILLRLELEEIVSTNFDLEEVELLLRSLGEAKCFLLESSLWHSRDFFGNVTNKERQRRLISLFEPILTSKRKPKRVQRHRGYRDKGCLKLPHEHHDFSDTGSEQYLLEQKRLTYQDTINFLRGWVT